MGSVQPFSRSCMLEWTEAQRSTGVAMADVSAKKNSGKYFLSAGETDTSVNHLFENRVKRMDITGVVDSLAALPARAQSFSRHHQKNTQKVLALKSRICLF